ncbi:MAG: 5-oxoprolinase [Planctomycetota bacterium]|nr:MAG: 5-oxoprolinase [Planctomycetota bacterium]
MSEAWDPILLAVWRHRFAAVAEEMLQALWRAAFSTNIKERRDHSAAVFTGRGEMVAHAAAIPVHLGSQPLSVQAALARFGASWAPGDAVLLNDPYEGGTHLPDLTLVTPVFEPGAAPGSEPAWIVATRAHHADVGGMSPGSLPLARELVQEGLCIPPVLLVRRGEVQDDLVRLIAANSRTPQERQGDLRAQLAANALGVERLLALTRARGEQARRYAAHLQDYAERMMRRFLAALPAGSYRFLDALESDGIGGGELPIQCQVTIAPRGEATIDFTGTAPASAGPLNANRAVTVAAVAYAFRIVCGAAVGSGEDDPPLNAGMLRPLALKIPPGSLLDPPRGHAVAGGNVETSQRIVDVVLGALAQACPELIPAASQGTMNNLTIGGVHPGRAGERFAYYETLGGGAGGGPRGPGAHAIQVHMTNTRNTPIEALEQELPLRVRRLAVRRGSGGRGLHPGGDGIVRELEVLVPATATLLTERRRRAPWGLGGGAPGAPGRNYLVRAGRAPAVPEPLPDKVSLELAPGDVLGMQTPGGGGWGSAPGAQDAGPLSSPR